MSKQAHALAIALGKELAKSEMRVLELKAEIKRLRPDAERYRWSLVNPIEYSQILFDCHHFGEDMQTSIDAAMEGE